MPLLMSGEREGEDLEGDEERGYSLVEGWEAEKDIKWKVSVIEGRRNICPF